jgi:hypothetical protein
VNLVKKMPLALYRRAFLAIKNMKRQGEVLP